MHPVFETIEEKRRGLRDRGMATQLAAGFEIALDELEEAFRAMNLSTSADDEGFITGVEVRAKYHIPQTTYYKWVSIGMPGIQMANRQWRHRESELAQWFTQRRRRRTERTTAR